MNRALASSAKPNAHVEVFDAQGYDYHKICDNLRFLSASICENKYSFMFHAKIAKAHIDSTLRFLREIKSQNTEQQCITKL